MRRRSAYVSPMLRVLKSALPAVVGLAWLVLPGQVAHAQERAVVVELFTSQGCNTCPPADAVLAELSGRDDLIALSLHVDYWDYLGWRDTFAQRRFTQRQVAYRDAWQKSVVYTPQMVIHGRRDVAATRTGEIDAAIDAARSGDAPVSLAILDQGGMLKCRIEPGPEPVTGTVWIAKYSLRTTVDIGRGENAGRTLTYANVVRSLNRIGDWSGAEPEEVAMPQPDPGEGVAVWIQAGESGPIFAAAKIENPGN
jgi:hypothetical protein